MLLKHLQTLSSSRKSSPVLAIQTVLEQTISTGWLSWQLSRPHRQPPAFKTNPRPTGQQHCGLLHTHFAFKNNCLVDILCPVGRHSNHRHHVKRINLTANNTKHTLFQYSYSTPLAQTRQWISTRETKTPSPHLPRTGTTAVIQVSCRTLPLSIPHKHNHTNPPWNSPVSKPSPQPRR